MSLVISAEQLIEEQRYDVEYYQVVMDLPRLLSVPVSNPIESEEIARELLITAKGRYPEAKLIKACWIYDSESQAGRQEFLAELEEKPTLYNQDQYILDHMNKINGVAA